MKFVELKCKNCGAKLEVEEGTTQVTCKFCDTSFSIDDAYTQGYKYTKGVLKAQDEQFEKDLERAKDFINNSSFAKSNKIFSIVFAAFFIIVFGFCIFGAYSTFVSSKEEDKKFDISSFNTTYEVHAGRCSGFFLINTLNDIVTNNKTNKEHIITVVYKNVSTINEKEVKEIRDSLSSSRDYDVSLDYDNEGYVNKFTISDIEISNKTNNIQVPDSDFDSMKEEVEQIISSVYDQMQE